jgi:hypothetical protein
VVLVVAAVAIPNLLRSKIAANEGTAVGSIRTVNTAQVTYVTEYPKKGYVRNLATLGPGPRIPAAYSEDHAGLLDESLGNGSCTGDVVYEIRIPLQSNSCLQAALMRGISGCCDADRYQHRSKKLLFNVGRRDPLQIQPSINRTNNLSECRTWSPLQ